ncbi:MAG: hypothetical protein NT085_04155 [candidate division SR1 bacterium]|nr:hypothetical protein [candidate division SR1 bacterium]
MEKAKTVFNKVLNRVPEITIYFWIIKILGTTIGETAADFLSTNLHLGLVNTSYVMGGLLAIVLAIQFKLKRYVAANYWIAVILISVVGTLITDQMVEGFGISLVTTTIIFSVGLALVFIIRYLKEKTLSIHSILTAKREAFYWLAILFTFALGTAGGDLLSEGLGIGYVQAGLIFAGAIALIAVIYYFFRTKKFTLNAIFAFWSVYILTRPLGASLGDYLTQAPQDGGLGISTAWITPIFLIGIISLVMYLSVKKVDVLTTVEK